MSGLSVIRRVSVLLLFILPFSGAAVADENSRLQGQIEAALFLSPELNSRLLDVAVEDGAVTIAGTLGSEDERQLALAIIEGMPGVDALTDDMTLSGGSDDSNVELSNAQQTALENWQLAHIGTELRRSFADSPALDGDNIEFSLDGTTLRLEGSVNTEIERTVASQLAQRLDQVQVVNNQLEVQETSEPVDSQDIAPE